MSARFLIVPQWQGSGSSRAMRLVTGAEAIRGDLPASSTATVEVPLEAGDAEGTRIRRLSTIRLVRERLTAALAEVENERGGTPIVIGGDCGVAYAPVEHAAQTRRVALLWIDAHPDAESAESSPSGAYTGMVLRHLVDDGVLHGSSIVLAGVRDASAAEESFLADAGVRVQDDPAGIAEALLATNADALHLHVDLDVLDPGAFDAAHSTVPFGWSVEQLLSTVREARATLPLVGASIAGFAPDDAQGADPSGDLATILRLVGALAKPA